MLAGEKYLNPDSYLNGLDPGDNATWDMGYDSNTIRWAGGGVSADSNISRARMFPEIPIRVHSAARTSMASAWPSATDRFGI